MSNTLHFGGGKPVNLIRTSEVIVYNDIVYNVYNVCFIFTCLLVHIFTCFFRIVSAVLTVFLMCFNLAYATKL